ncbi:MAG: hypothetical protein OEY28_06125 [Nitrospira sp.]|nr:hypothetical protein [Nitrospira sp.]
MADTQRQQIMTALGARLATIRVANGYRTDIGANVSEGYIGEMTPASLPAVLYRDISQKTQAELSRHRHTLGVEIGIAIEGVAPLPTIRAATDDIHKALGVDITFGGLAIQIDPPSSSWEINDEGGQIITEIRFTTTINYRTTEWTT